MKRVYYVMTLFFILVIVLSTRTYSQDIHIGKLKILPSIQAEVIYDTNIYATSDNEVDDIIYLITPGISFFRPFGGRSSFQLDYQADIKTYAEETDNNYIRHLLKGTIDIGFAGGFFIKLQDEFLKSMEERMPERGDKKDFMENTASIQTGYELTRKWSITGKYAYTIFDYEDNQFDSGDYTSQLLGGEIQRRLSPKTRGLLGYEIAWRKYHASEIDDTTLQTAYIGLSWDPTSKIKGDLKGGYTWLKYDNDLPERDNEPSTWYISVNLDYEMNKRTHVELSGKRSYNQDSDAANASYVSNEYGLTLKRSLWSRWSLLAGYNLTMADYVDSQLDPETGEAKSRQDITHEFKFKAEYKMRTWLRIGLGYTYIERQSDFSYLEYNESESSAFLKAEF